MRVFRIAAWLLLAAAAWPAQMPEGNPLLDLRVPLPFDRIRAEHIVPAVQFLIEEGRKEHEAYVAGTEKLTFENTILAYAEIGDRLDRAMSVVSHLDGVRSTPQLRAAIAQALPQITGFRNGVTLDPRVWAKVKRYLASEEARTLSGNRRRLLDLTLKRFRRAGAELDEGARARMREINVELASLSKRFNDNALESTNAFELVITDESKLAGLTETARIAARQAAQDKGVEGWRFTLQAPSVMAALQYLDDASLRERVYRASISVASEGRWDNRPLIRRILELRRERARLLGYRDWADYQTEERMAGSGAKVRDFLATLEEKTRAAFERERRELIEFRRKLEGPAAPPPAPWDTQYYTRKLRQARYDLDSEALRPYFAFERVMQGLFEIAGRLYGVKFARVAGAPVWHPSVEYWELRDAGGQLLGFFYTDFFARSDKRSGAWCSSLVSRRADRPQVGVIVGNLTPPAGGKPSLLTHNEVNTIFHEFGHLMAQLLNRVPEPGLRGYVWDFVELPSQIMENFAWNRECLDLFARHYQTGERIPDDLFRRMIAARNFNAAHAQMNQLGLATVDLALHTEYDPARDPDPQRYARNIMQRFVSHELPKEYSQVTRFLHLFAGAYSAGYYSYKWAEVLEADAFTRFEKEGVLNPKVGMELRRKILERGNDVDAAQLFRDFMGRDPDPGALLRRLGLQ
jgi:oligopeptidase A